MGRAKRSEASRAEGERSEASPRGRDRRRGGGVPGRRWRGGRPRAQVAGRHVELEEREHLRLDHLLPELVRVVRLPLFEAVHRLVEVDLGALSRRVGGRQRLLVADLADGVTAEQAGPGGAAVGAQLAVALIERAQVGLGLGIADLVRPAREIEDPERGVDLHVLRDGAAGAGQGAVVDAERGVGLARLNEKGDDVDVRLVAIVVGLERVVEPLQRLAATAEEVEQLADLDGRLGRLGDVLAAEVLDHQPLPADERASPGGRRPVAIARRVEGVAQQPVEPRAPLDGADGVLRRALGAHGVDPLADDPRGARRIAALERQVGQLDRHLGGRLAFVARADEKRLGAVDEARVDVAARQLEVDVGVAHLHLRAGEAALGVLESPLGDRRPRRRRACRARDRGAAAAGRSRARSARPRSSPPARAPPGWSRAPPPPLRAAGWPGSKTTAGARRGRRG